MRALRLLTLAAALAVPAVAAHAQYSVYVGPPPPYAAAYGYGGGYWVPGHWAYEGWRRCWVPAHFVGRPGYGHYGWHERYGWHRGW